MLSKIKKKIKHAFLWFILLSFINFSFAADYRYTNLEIYADIKIDGTIDVTENFTADFFTYKHGIIREIPLNYSVDWQPFHIEINNINVKWKKFSTAKENWIISIKIWDANKTIIWTQNYPISYSTYWLIRNFSGMWFAELYWNIVWYDFDTSIWQVYAELSLPKPYTWFTENDFLITVDWSSYLAKDFDWTIDRKSWEKIIIKYNKELTAYQWITLAVRLPNDYFEFNHRKQESLIWDALIWIWEIFWDFITNGYFGKIVLLYGSTILWIYLIWWKIMNKTKWIQRSKIEKKILKKQQIIVQYLPPKWINCAEAWLIFDGILQNTDMISLLYKWTIEWLIKIFTDISTWANDTTPKYFRIEKLKEIPSTYPEYEKNFFKDIFLWWTSDSVLFSNKILVNFDKNSKLLETYAKKQWWIKSSIFFSLSKSIKQILLLILLIFVVFYCFYKYYLDFIIWFYIIIFWYNIISTYFFKEDFKDITVNLTNKWLKIAAHLIWYSYFIKTCDEKILETFLKQDPLFINKTLPYAVAFWMETEFIKKAANVLKCLKIHPISWFNENFNWMLKVSRIAKENAIYERSKREKEYKNKLNSVHVNYSSWWGFSSWSSFWWWFWWWFSRGWGWWWGWWKSW